MNIYNFNKILDKRILSKGKTYYQDGYIKSVSFNPEENVFTGDILGSMLYETKIFFDEQNEIHSTCSCPVDGICKHVGALLYDIKENSALLSLIDDSIIEKEYLTTDREIIEINNIVKNKFKHPDAVKMFFDKVLNIIS